MIVGSYTLLDKIAEGSIADIYLAKTLAVTGEEKFVVCKCLKKCFTEDDEFRGTLNTEIKIAARLRHPNILSIFDICRVDDTVFLSMEYMDAKDMQSLLTALSEKKTVMPFDVAIYVITQIAQGLHAAHEMRDEFGIPLNLVHRDISPENILFAQNGDIKISDFGIAKTNKMPDITPKDVIKGKFNYMSPEHAWGDKLDRRSDLFSVAIILYEATLGRSFYPTDSIAETISCARMTLFELPKNINPAYPDDLNEVLLKALDLDRNNRYQNLGEFIDALDKCVKNHNWNMTPKAWLQYLRRTLDLSDEEVPRIGTNDLMPDPNSIMEATINPEEARMNGKTDVITEGQVNEVLIALGLRPAPEAPASVSQAELLKKVHAAAGSSLLKTQSEFIKGQMSSNASPTSQAEYIKKVYAARASSEIKSPYDFDPANATQQIDLPDEDSMRPTVPDSGIFSRLTPISSEHEITQETSESLSATIPYAKKTPIIQKARVTQELDMPKEASDISAEDVSTEKDNPVFGPRKRSFSTQKLLVIIIILLLLVIIGLLYYYTQYTPL